MKRLLCYADLKNNEELNEHYIFYYKIEPDNRYFKKPFQSNKNCSIFCKCLRCHDFLTTSDFKANHDLLKHYNEGYNGMFEDKPVDIVKTASLLKFEISVSKHVIYK